VVEDQTDLICRCLPDGTVTFLNEACCRFFNITAEQLVGHSFVSLMTDEERQKFARIVSSLTPENPVVTLEHLSRLPDGRQYWLQWSVRGLFEDGHLIELQAVGRDISRRKRLQEQLDAIYDLGRKLVLTRDVTEVATAVVGAARQILGFSVCGLFLVDERQQALVRVAHTTDPEAPDVPPLPLDSDCGITVAVARTGEPIYLPDVRQDPRYMSGGFPALSELCVPLKVGDRVIGVLNAESDCLDAFGPTERQLLEALANVAAVALENARLFEETQRGAEETAALLDIAKAISSLDLDAVLHTIASRAKALFKADGSRIHLIEPDGETLRCAIALHNRAEAVMALRLKLGQGFTGRVALKGEPELIPNTLDDPDHIQVPGTPVEVESVMLAPLKVRGRVMGVMTVTRLGEDRPFTSADLRLLTAFAGQAAVALENARLYQETQRRAEELAALREVSLATVSTLERDQVFEVMLDQLGKVIDYDAAYIKIITPDGKDKMIAGRGPVIHDQAMWNGFDVKDNKLVHEMRETGRPVVVHDARTDERYQKVGDWEAFPSWAGAPLFVKGDFVGYLAVEKSSPGFYDENAIQLLGDFARAAAIALENARLYEDVRKRAAYQEALNAIIGYAATTMDMQSLLEAALDHTLEALGLEIGAIWLVEAPGTGVLLHVVRGVSPERQRQMCLEIPKVALAAGLDGSETQIVEDWEAVEGQISALAPVMIRFNIGASLTVPVLTDGRPIGGLSVAAPEPRPWTTEEITLVEAIGRQLGAVAARLCLLAQVQDQARQVQEIMESVPEGMLLLDPDLHIIMANPMAQEYLKVLGDARVGEVLTHLGGVPIEELLQPPVDGLSHEVELEGPVPRVFEVVARSVGQQPESRGWVLVVRDVTREREAQAQAQQQERLAAVGQLAAGIAHDFNNILTSIIGFAQLAQGAPGVPSSVKTDLERIAQQGHRAARLVQQILDFSRRSTIERRPMDLVSFVKETVRFLERTIPETIRISLHYEPGEYLVNGDPAQLHQMLANLAVNARDAMPAGGELRLALSRLTLEPGEPPPCADMSPGEYIALSVSDTGVGIPADILPRIFEPFFTTKEVGQGAGLGLAQVYGIVKQHEGFIDVTSQVGIGTTFTVYLPALVMPPGPGVEEVKEIPRGRGETVLLVEDDPAVLQAAQGMLEHLGYRVLTARNGEEALAVHARHQGEIDLVVSDMVMPGMGGEELFRALRQRDPQIRMVLITGYPLGEDITRLRAEGIVEWVQKPFLLDELARVVNRILKGKVQTPRAH
jgi:PAS domain S-box-containing protein